MDKIRKLIQSKLNECALVSSGVAIADDMVEVGQTYFGYEIQRSFRDEDYDNNYTYEINISGRLVRKNDSTENTIQIIDEALNELVEKLKEIHVRCNTRDVTMEDSLRKVVVTGYFNYDELTNKIY